MSDDELDAEPLTKNLSCVYKGEDVAAAARFYREGLETRFCGEDDCERCKGFERALELFQRAFNPVINNNGDGE